VKLLCQFRGREMEFKQLAFDMFAKFATDLKDDGAIETRPSIEGRAMMMILAPLKSDTLAKAAAEKAAQQPKAALAKKPVLDTPAAAPEAAAAPAPVAAAEPVAAAASE
jgi:translation initiation factor IF-3